VCHDHLSGDADALIYHCIHELRVIGHRDALSQPFSRILSRTVGGAFVRLLSRAPLCSGQDSPSAFLDSRMNVSPCPGVRSIRGLPTLRVDATRSMHNQWISFHLSTILGVTYISFW
jgi:hypothetical protein